MNLSASSLLFKRQTFKYLLYFLMLIIAGSIIYKNTSNELILKVSNISLIPNSNPCKVLFSLENLTNKELSAVIAVNVIFYIDPKTAAEVNMAETNILGSEEMEINLLPRESKKIQKVVKITDYPLMYPAGNKMAEVRIIKVNTQINQPSAK